MLVWHDNHTGRLIFHDLGRLTDGNFSTPSFTMEQPRCEQLKLCLIPDTRSRCALVFSDSRGFEIVILRYPEMSVDQHMAIPFPQGPDLLIYATGAAISASGQRIAVASNSAVWILEEQENVWHSRQACSIHARAYSELAWSPDEQLLAVGWCRNLLVAHVSREKTDMLPIKAVPRPSVDELREHSSEWWEQAKRGSLYEVGLSLSGVYSVEFFQQGGLFAASGCTPDKKDRVPGSIIPAGGGFVALWDTRNSRLVSCDFLQGAFATGMRACWPRRSYFVSLSDRTDGNKSIQEIGIDGSHSRAIYRMPPGSDAYDRIIQFAVSLTHSRLVAIDQDGRVVTWSLSDYSEEDRSPPAKNGPEE